jgi:hypothetical protein
MVSIAPLVPYAIPPVHRMADATRSRSRSRSPGHQARGSVSPARSTKRRSSASPGRTSRSRSPHASPGKRKKRKKKTAEAGADDDDEPDTPPQEEEEDDEPVPPIDDTMDDTEDTGEPDDNESYDGERLARRLASLAEGYKEILPGGEPDQLIRVKNVHFDVHLTQGQTRKIDPAHVAEVEDGMIQNPPLTFVNVILWRKTASSMLCP